MTERYADQLMKKERALFEAKKLAEDRKTMLAQTQLELQEQLQGV